MGKRVTIEDISRAAGVSTATVSYFLNGHYGNMSEEVRQRLERLVREMGYRPNNLARSLKSKQSKNVALVIPGLYGQIAFLVVAGACRVLDAAGYTVSVMLTNESIEKERDYIEQSLADQVCGLIVVPSMTRGETNLAYLQELCRGGTPIVTTTRCPQDWPFDGVRLDYARSVDTLVRHFHTCGYRTVALFLDAEDTPYINYTKSFRRDVFLESMQRYFHADAKNQVWYGIKTDTAAMAALREYDERCPEGPKAVFAVNSPTLGVTLQAMQTMGLAIPQEYGMGGYGGWDWTSYTSPTITTLSQPLDQVGSTAAELLLRRIAQPDAEPKLCLLDSTLTPRRSTELRAQP